MLKNRGVGVPRSLAFRSQGTERISIFAFLKVFSIYHVVYMILFVILLQIVLRSPFLERGTPTRSRSQECGTYPVPRSRSGERNAYPFFLFFITEHITGTSISMHISC